MIAMIKESVAFLSLIKVIVHFQIFIAQFMSAPGSWKIFLTTVGTEPTILSTQNQRNISNTIFTLAHNRYIKLWLYIKLHWYPSKELYEVLKNHILAAGALVGRIWNESSLEREKLEEASGRKVEGAKNRFILTYFKLLPFLASPLPNPPPPQSAGYAG